MKLQHLTEYLGLRLLMSISSRLSPNRSYRVGGKIGELAFKLKSMRREMVMAHLSRVYGDSVSTEGQRNLARAVYRQLGQTAVEHARLLGRKTLNVQKRLSISGETHISEARQRNRGVILVTGHFGYWELLGAAVAQMGHPITVITKDLHNPLVNRLVQGGRERLGMALAPMSTAPNAILKALRRNECVGALADQDAGSGGIFVEFLGQPASTYQGPALFALRTGAPIVPCFIVRSGPEKHEVRFESPIEPISTGGESEEILRITQAYTDVLARYIHEFPDHWFWVHRRWKTQAPDVSVPNT